MTMSTVLGCLKKADIDYNLINDGDRICVGISGGKDSMVLAKALQLYKHFSKKQYEVVCVHIEMGFPTSDFSNIEEYFNENEIEYHVVPSKPMIYEVLKLNLTNAGKLPCSICSKMKKAAICQAAHQFNCNKVAFAHHADDAIETFFMNMIYGGRLATFLPKMDLTRENVTFIRPLIYCKEKVISKTLTTSKIPFAISTCPNDKTTERENIKQILNNLYKTHPEAKANFLNMLHNKEKMELWEKENTSE